MGRKIFSYWVKDSIYLSTSGHLLLFDEWLADSIMNTITSKTFFLLLNFIQQFSPILISILHQILLLLHPKIQLTHFPTVSFSTKNFLPILKYLFFWFHALMIFLSIKMIFNTWNHAYNFRDNLLYVEAKKKVEFEKSRRERLAEGKFLKESNKNMTEMLFSDFGLLGDAWR